MSANFVGLQKPLQTPVLALSEMIEGWWIDQPKRCGSCRGRMVVDPPTYERGRLLCLDCGREVADVVVARREPYVPRLVICPTDGYQHSEMARCGRCVNREQMRRYREQRKPQQASDPERYCTWCKAAAPMPSHTRCGGCRYRVDKARKERAG